VGGRGREFTSVEFGRYCAKHDVERHLTDPYSLQQNEVVEHRNQSMIAIARCMLRSYTRRSAFALRLRGRNVGLKTLTRVLLQSIL
jgi:transposase InsO family protein